MQSYTPLHRLIIGICVLVGAGVLFVGASVLGRYVTKIPEVFSAFGCSVETESMEVRGSSMAPLVEKGETVRVEKGSAECRTLSRGDLVVYNYAGNSAPLLKAVHAAPGDRLSFAEADSRGWHILVNGEVAKNSSGVPYTIDERAHRLLSSYARQNDPLPEDTYMILGEEPRGSTDSTIFGLVDAEDIYGRAEVRQ